MTEALCHMAAGEQSFLPGRQQTGGFPRRLLNGLTIEAEEAEVVAVMKDLAAGRLPEAGLALWLRMVSK